MRTIGVGLAAIFMVVGVLLGISAFANAPDWVRYAMGSSLSFLVVSLVCGMLME